MTRFITMVLLAALTTTPVLAQNSRGGASSGGGAAAEDDGGHNFHAMLQARNNALRVAGGPDDSQPAGEPASVWSRWADEICGGDSLIWYDEDENGDPEDGTVEYECLDD